MRWLADLIVLGNGFDLALKMETKYLQFFNDRQLNMGFKSIIDKAVSGSSGINIIENNINHIPQLKDLTYWDIIFSFAEIFKKDLSSWANIELMIKNIVVNNYYHSWDNQSYVNVIFPEAKKYTYKEPYADEKFRCQGILELFLKYKTESKDYSQYYAFLLNELKKFEEAFAVYITKIDKNNEHQKKFALDTINNILEKNLFGNKLYLLSFNYTSELLSLEAEDTKLFDIDDNFVHIHGRAKNGSVIFGIDEKNGKDRITPNTDKYKFTKTARLIDSKFSDHQTPQILNWLDKDNTVRFFGHSLSEFDYSYFFSIFDFYELYESTVALKFFFMNYSPGIKESYLASIIKLLKEYGVTMDNKDHGDNLLHKLLLEGRLKIIEIPEMPQEDETTS